MNAHRPSFGSPVIQAAGVLGPDEALMLAQSGFTHVGIPLRLAHHSEDVDDSGAARIVAALQGKAEPVLITYLTDPGEVSALADALGIRTVQLHADLQVPGLARLRELRPDFWLIKSLIVRAGNIEELLRRAEAAAPHVDAFLTDTHDPATGAVGATGKTHDWSVSARLAESLDKPLILAGGLDADNVSEAVRTVRPSGVDAHSGVEDASGRKDPALARAFVSEARRALEAWPRKR